MSKDESVEEWAARARLQEIEAAAAEIVEVGNCFFGAVSLLIRHCIGGIGSIHA
jgi:hypothetical protein